jgi:hypothetical protein
LGNDSDVADYMLLAHGGPRSNTSASVDSGGTSGHEDRRI